MGTQIVTALGTCITTVYDMYVRFLEETGMTGYVIAAFFLLILVRLFIGPLVGAAISPGIGSDEAAGISGIKNQRGKFSQPRNKRR